MLDELVAREDAEPVGMASSDATLNVASSRSRADSAARSVLLLEPVAAPVRVSSFAAKTSAATSAPMTTTARSAAARATPSRREHKHPARVTAPDSGERWPPASNPPMRGLDRQVETVPLVRLGPLSRRAPERAENRRGPSSGPRNPDSGRTIHSSRCLKCMA